MKSNEELGYEEILSVDGYEVGKRGGKYRAYGHEWHSEQDASREFAHHEVCGRGTTPTEAIENLIQAAIRAGKVGQHCWQYGTPAEGLNVSQAMRLRDELLEELAELEDMVEMDEQKTVKQLEETLSKILPLA
tara:strand:+ start:250 stop:648 length:399 start_codon:yes stop_codon:yes gene_type:complete